MTQHALILAYIAEHGSILPARMYGEIYKGQMFGSETSKRCRELRNKFILVSKKEGKFERFYLAEARKRAETILENYPPRKVEEKVASLF